MLKLLQPAGALKIEKSAILLVITDEDAETDFGAAGSLIYGKEENSTATLGMLALICGLG